MIKNIIVVAISAIVISFTSLKNKAFIPPGTVQISETFFADETEISNFAWQEYELSVKTKYGYLSPEHLAALPDTLVWRQKNSSNEPYVKYYYRHPAYKGYPVVGISYEQATAFCKWRTERVKEFYYIKNKKEITIEYRLPTKEEWELLSSVPSYFFNNGGKNKKGEILFNHCWMTDSIWKKHIKEHPEPADVTAPVYSYWKNNFGLFNTFGNVAEMINQKGICKGGGWKHQIEECRAGKDISYSQPTAWLGFRCVCVITK